MQNRYTTLLFDADNTLLDFSKSERASLIRTMEAYGVPATDENIEIYVEINKSLWKRLEKGEITKPELKKIRFGLFFESIGFKTDADTLQVNNHYLSLLSDCGYTMEGAAALCEKLVNAGYNLYVVTNGIARTQANRLQKSGLLPYLKDVFVSESIGYPKPMKEFFDYVTEKIPEKEKSRILVIGDSLSSDILGAVNSSLDSVWLNPEKLSPPDSYNPTYTIESLKELERLLL